MYKVEFDGDPIVKAGNAINAVTSTVRSNIHINELVRQANRIITAEFVLHMSARSVSEPKKFAHMYEWGQLGDPSGRLWRHHLRGAGAMRMLTYSFKASRKTVPVSPRLSSVGVQQRHVFVWKAAVIEKGQPVTISPKIAQVLVFEAKSLEPGSPLRKMGQVTPSGIVYFDGTIHLDRQGPAEAWGAFDGEFRSYFSSEIPEMHIRSKLGTVFSKTLRGEFAKKMRSIKAGKSKKKSFSLTPAGVDKSFERTLTNSLNVNYAAAAANRRVLTSGDEV